MSVRLTTTTELLDALHRGPREPAWDLFVARYQPVLVGVARRLGLGRDDALDAAQQTLLEFVRDFRSGRYHRDKGRLRHWILAILRHRVHDLHRIRARVRKQGATAEPPADEPERLNALWQAQVQQRILADALAMLRDRSGLAERSIRAFELTALKGVSAEVAAESCGLTVDGVYVARSRVTARLRRIVRDLEQAYEDP